MNFNDTVIYSEKHHDWMVKAGIWPSHLSREDVQGKVIALHDDLVDVDWQENLIYRERINGYNVLIHDVVFSHFPENIEVLE